MLDAALLENEDSELDRAQFERAIQRAANDLQRIIGTLVQRYLPRRSQPSTLTWRWLIELEEQAFSDLGFQSRHDNAIIGAFLRLRDSRLFGANIDEMVDWRRDDDDLPAVYLILRAFLDAEAGAAA
jgi:Protein of unknown function (DUF2471)